MFACPRFFMRRLYVVALAVAFLGACASSRAHSSRPHAQIAIVQTSNVPAVARHVTGGLAIHYAARVGNPFSEKITLTRISVQSITQGAYTVGPHSVPFNVVIAPDTAQDVQFWAPAQAGNSIVGVNGPVTLRVVAEFDSEPYGRFQEIVTRVVNQSASITGDQ